MSRNTIRRQRRSALLIDPSLVATRTDRGATWVTDRYVVVRAELFKNTAPERNDFQFTSKILRTLLAMARPVATAPLRSLGEYERAHGEPGVVFTDGISVGAVNARVWKGLAAAGLTPRWSPDRKSVSWWARIRGKDALYAVVMCLRPDWAEFLRPAPEESAA